MYKTFGGIALGSFFQLDGGVYQKISMTHAKKIEGKNPGTNKRIFFSAIVWEVYKIS